MNKVITIVALVLFTSAVSAEPTDKVTNWFVNEKAKTIEFQKKQWADAKKKWTDLVTKFGIAGKKQND